MVSNRSVPTNILLSHLVYPEVSEAVSWLTKTFGFREHFRYVLIVADPDSLFQRVIAAGAKEVWPVADQHYRWRMGRLVDPFGHHWEIGKPLVS